MKKLVRESLSPSEAVYGFAAWLTTRDKAITISGHHDAGLVAELVDIYVKKQKLKEPRSGENTDWTKDLIPMNESYNKNPKMETNKFGWNVPIKDYTDKVFDFLVDLVRQKRNISEKSFKQYDELIEDIRNLFDETPQLIQELKTFENNGYEHELSAHLIYELYIKEKGES